MSLLNGFEQLIGSVAHALDPHQLQPQIIQKQVSDNINTATGFGGVGAASPYRQQINTQAFQAPATSPLNVQWGVPTQIPGGSIEQGYIHIQPQANPFYGSSSMRPIPVPQVNPNPLRQSI